MKEIERVRQAGIAAQTRGAIEPTRIPVPVGSPQLARGLSGADTDERLVGLWLHGKSEGTVEAYRSDISKFVDFTEGKPLRAVTLADVQDFADFISELLALASRARTLAALKSLFAFGHQVGYLPFEGESYGCCHQPQPSSTPRKGQLRHLIDVQFQFKNCSKIISSTASHITSLQRHS